jgi:hypothetical protein
MQPSRNIVTVNKNSRPFPLFAQKTKMSTDSDVYREVEYKSRRGAKTGDTSNMLLVKAPLGKVRALLNNYLEHREQGGCERDL